MILVAAHSTVDDSDANETPGVTGHRNDIGPNGDTRIFDFMTVITARAAKA